MAGRIDAADLLMVGVVVVVSALLLIGALSIPPPMFDPVGSAAVPRGVAIVLLVLVGLHLVVRLRQPPRGEPVRLGELGMGGGAVLTLVVTLVYCAVLQLRLLPFAVPTAAFLLVLIPALAASWKRLPMAIAIGIVMGIGCQWLFTEIFFIDLPQPY
jgi:putative tricarboxylic transport membrane protein